LNLDEKLLPQYLKPLGYQCHAIGKCVCSPLPRDAHSSSREGTR
jgi:arylsulfatase A-like enzyme